MLAGSYDSLLVLFSFLVAMLASYTALDMVGRISTAAASAARWWLAGGALALGFGIWSMHFIGMLAFSLPMTLGYDLPLTLLSLAIAIASSILPLWLGSRRNLPWSRLLLGSLLLGAGIAAMHYTGMAAMKMMPAIVYDPSLVVLSVAIAVLAAALTLWTAFHLRRHGEHVRHVRMVAAALMGTTIVAMHYTGMHAAQFPVGAVCGAADSGLHAASLAIPIIVVTISVLAVALITSILDMRLETRTAILSTSLAQANSELSHLVQHDSLTRLPNRLLLEYRLRQAIDGADAGKLTFATLFMDLDGFKAVNDTFGHHVGDTLLAQVADRIRANIRPSDVVARVGGDEFVLLAKVYEAKDATTIAESLVAVLSEPFNIVGQELRISVSIGIALYSRDGDNPHDLIRNADIAMYHAKSQGRSQARFFEKSMHASSEDHLMLLQDLRLACERKQLMLYYQPKFTAPSGPVTGVEALLRWNHPTRGIVEPDAFIGLAERTGLIIQIGEWVIDEACRQLRLWQRDAWPQLTVAVNISALQFSHPRLISTVSAALQRYCLAPDSLTLEITESTAIRDIDASMQILQQLRTLGVRIAIDDFGTGYSSLLYLKRLPASELKIDRAFVSDLGVDAGNGAIVSAIVSLGQTLHLNIVAEGVETGAQQDLLTRMGCHSLQGFLLCRPQPAAELERFLVTADPHEPSQEIS
ncbi:putative bifunctional diguanylate cyclase/phosphodiesterase [Caballeronia sp. DA-9]|uniref:putative bifunctional diguanylate cyclase/phosphodiesterase n=1 Tax=Caballeronia sp. DA-9 TaxID=3436237 RepID=UPI003F66223C